MKIFVGSIKTHSPSDIPESFDADVIKTGEKSFWIMGAEENIASREELIQLLESFFGDIESYEISLEWEDEIEVLAPEYEDGIYEGVTFEGPEISFESVLERFADTAEVVCIREAGISGIYENKKIKVDFVY